MLDTIIQLTASQLTLGVGIIGVFQWLLAVWIKARIEGSIRSEYDRQLEEYKFLISKREKIANVASFLAKWIKYRGHERKWLSDPKELVNYYEELTRMSFELVMWIDDESFLKSVMKRLRNEKGAPDTLELLLRAKELVSGLENKELVKGDVTLWPNDESFFSKGP